MSLSLKCLFATTALVTTTLFASGSAYAAEKVKVVASFSILGDMVSRVGGDLVELTTIVGVDGDAHVYEPKPDDAKAMAAAKVVFVNGLAFEGWLDRLVESSGYQGPLIKTTDGIKPAKMAEAHGEELAEHEDETEKAEGEAHDHGELDPHAWQNAANALVYVKNITDALCAADKEDCSTYTANAETYSNEIKMLDTAIKAAVAKTEKSRRTVITSHDAFGYYSRAYGITFLAPEGVSTESEASAKDVAKLIDQIREDKASALFVENISDPRMIEQIANETKMKIGGALYSDALSTGDGPAPTYIDMMKHNTRLLTEAIAGS